MDNISNSPYRPRRLRGSAGIRRMVRETRLAPDDFIYPLFVRHGAGVRQPIASMPGIAQLSVDEAVKEAETAAALGIPAVILFGIPAEKDPIGQENFATTALSSGRFGRLKRPSPIWSSSPTFVYANIPITVTAACWTARAMC
jgi:porphobilinogen synthase